MKELILFLLISFLAIISCTSCYGQVDIPDQIQLVTVDGDTVVVSTTEFENLLDKYVEIKNAIKEEASKGPKTPLDWFIFIVSLFIASGGVTIFTNLLKVSKTIINVLTLKMGVVQFVVGISLIVAIALCYFKDSVITVDCVVALWGAVFMISTVIYRAFFKKREVVAEQ